MSFRCTHTVTQYAYIFFFSWGSCQQSVTCLGKSERDRWTVTVTVTVTVTATMTDDEMMTDRILKLPADFDGMMLLQRFDVMRGHQRRHTLST
jgi:hypothetical protein